MSPSETKKSETPSSNSTAKTTAKNTTKPTAQPERVQKIIAQAGIVSRRDAEELIREGQVTINGEIAKLGDKAIYGKDAIKVRGKLLLFSPHKVYYLFYKPKNVIAMVNEDEEGRATIKDLIQKQIKERVFTVGRMDFTGEGAIILTNDGEITQRILKSNDIIRRYHVKVDRLPTNEELARLARGGRIEGVSMHPHHVRIAEAYTRNALVEISFEGMGAIDVRKYFENKGFFPERVARVGIGHISAEKMKPGHIKRLEASSVEALFNQPELAKKQIDRLVKTKSEKTRVIEDEDKLDTPRRKPAKTGLFASIGGSEGTGRPLGGTTGAGRSLGGTTGAGRPPRTFGKSESRPYGKREKRSSSGEFSPRAERPAKAFGDRPARSDRPARGDRSRIRFKG